MKSSASADPTKRAGDEQIDRWCREEESNLPTYGFSRTYLSQLAHHLGTTPSSRKENFPRSRKLAFLRNVGTERGRTFVLSKPRLRSAICAAFSRRLRKTAKTLNHQCRRNSGLSVVSRELTSPYNREELYKRVWSQATYGLSDLRLGKVCKKLKIPVPGRGYWANKSAGKPVATRPPLPSAANPPIRVPH